MADDKKMKQAQTVYQTACRALDNAGWKYDRHDEDMMITCGAQGEDLPMDILLRVNADAQVIALYSPLPFKIAADKRADGALATCFVNDGLLNGCFDYDLGSGAIVFRMVSSYRGSLIGEELISYMVYVSASTVDDYNDKFLMLSKGMLSLEQFLESENKTEDE